MISVDKIAKKITKEFIGKYIHDPQHRLPLRPGFHWTQKGQSDSPINKSKYKGKQDESIKQFEQQSKSKTKNEFQGIQGTNFLLSDTDARMFHSGRKQLDEKIRRGLSRVLQRELFRRSRRMRYGNESLVNPKTGKTIEFYSNVDGEAFRECFASCRQYLKNGDCVTIHQQSQYNQTQNYLSTDGLSGIAITRDGDLQSVFSIRADKGFLKTIAPIVRKKVKTLDCYQSTVHPLSSIYSSIFTFQTTSVLAYNKQVVKNNFGEEYANYFTKTYNSPPVYFMVNPSFSYDIKRIVPKCFNKEDKIKAIYFDKNDYDGAFLYQQFMVGNLKLSDKTLQIMKDKTPQQIIELLKAIYLKG